MVLCGPSLASDLKSKKCGKIPAPGVVSAVVKKWTLPKTEWQHRLKEQGRRNLWPQTKWVTLVLSTVGTEMHHCGLQFWKNTNFNSSVWLRSSYEPIVCYFSRFASLLLRFLRVCAICGSNCVLLKAVAVRRSKMINLLLQYEFNTSVHYMLYIQNKRYL